MGSDIWINISTLPLWIWCLPWGGLPSFRITELRSGLGLWIRWSHPLFEYLHKNGLEDRHHRSECNSSSQKGSTMLMKEAIWNHYEAIEFLNHSFPITTIFIFSALLLSKIIKIVTAYQVLNVLPVFGYLMEPISIFLGKSESPSWYRGASIRSFGNPTGRHVTHKESFPSILVSAKDPFSPTWRKTMVCQERSPGSPLSRNTGIEINAEVERSKPRRRFWSCPCRSRLGLSLYRSRRVVAKKNIATLNHWLQDTYREAHNNK